MINYGSIERPIVKPATDRQKYFASRQSKLKQLGLCIACGKVPVSRFAKCLNCRLGRKSPR